MRRRRAYLLAFAWVFGVSVPCNAQVKSFSDYLKLYGLDKNVTIASPYVVDITFTAGASRDKLHLEKLYICKNNHYSTKEEWVIDELGGTYYYDYKVKGRTFSGPINFVNLQTNNMFFTYTPAPGGGVSAIGGFIMINDSGFTYYKVNNRAVMAQKETILKKYKVKISSEKNGIALDADGDADSILNFLRNHPQALLLPVYECTKAGF